MAASRKLTHYPELPEPEPVAEQAQPPPPDRDPRRVLYEEWDSRGHLRERYPDVARRLDRKEKRNR